MGGLGWGDGNVAIVLTLIIFCFVTILAITRADVQKARKVHRAHAGAGPATAESSPEGLD